MLDLFGNEIEEEKPKGSRKIFACIGASNHVAEDRQQEDFYATSPESVEALLKVEKFSNTILEPCVGMGHIAETLIGGGIRLYVKILSTGVILIQQYKIFLHKKKTAMI